LEVAAAFVLAMSENNAGNYRRSLELLTPLLSVGGHQNETFVAQHPPLMARYWMVLNCVQIGEFNSAMRLIEEWRLQLNAENDVLGSETLYLQISRGRLLNAIGDFHEATRTYETGFDVYREDCHGNFYFALAWGLGLAYALSGRVTDSLAQFESAKEVAARRGTTAFTGMWLLHLGRAFVEAGRLDEAARMAGDALSMQSRNGHRPGEAGALGLLGEVAMRRDPVDVEKVQEYLLKALTLAESMEMRPLAARCHVRLAWLYAKTGRGDGTHHNKAAESLLDQMGRPLSLAAAALH
jgi:tetratricopeptide (TPR) repeat protein